MNIIIGPPGTGKTTNLLSLVEDELSKGTSSKDIGYFAFTNRATDEAKSRANTKFNLESDPCFRHDRIRSWFQPLIYYLISKTLIIFNITDPFNWSLFYRLFSSVLGWSAIVLIVKNNTSFFSTPITRNIFIISSLFF